MWTKYTQRCYIIFQSFREKMSDWQQAGQLKQFVTKKIETHWFQDNLLGLERRYSLSSAQLVTYLHTWKLKVAINFLNFKLMDKYSNSGISFSIGYSNFSLWDWYAEHERRKWTSFSINPGQKGQNRISLWIPLCRPISIIKRWLESLNLVIWIRAVFFFTFVK